MTQLSSIELATDAHFCTTGEKVLSVPRDSGGAAARRRVCGVLGGGGHGGVPAVRRRVRVCRVRAAHAQMRHVSHAATAARLAPLNRSRARALPRIRARPNRVLLILLKHAQPSQNRL